LEIGAEHDNGVTAHNKEFREAAIRARGGYSNHLCRFESDGRTGQKTEAVRVVNGSLGRVSPEHKQQIGRRHRQNRRETG
jgi:hypothetical protein